MKPKYYVLFDSLKPLFNKIKWWDSFSREIIPRSTVFNKTEQTDMLQVEQEAPKSLSLTATITSEKPQTSESLAL